MVTRLRQRIERLARRAPRPEPELTPEQQREWCLQLGLAPDSVLLGSPRTGFVVLPALVVA